MLDPPRSSSSTSSRLPPPPTHTLPGRSPSPFPCCLPPKPKSVQNYLWRNSKIRVLALHCQLHDTFNLLPGLEDKAVLRMRLQSTGKLLPGHPMFVQDDVLLGLVHLHQIGLELHQRCFLLTGWYLLHQRQTDLLREVARHYQHLVFYLLDYLACLGQGYAFGLALVVAALQIEEQPEDGCRQSHRCCYGFAVHLSNASISYRVRQLQSMFDLNQQQLTSFKKAFDLFDKDGNGKINKEEITTVFKELNIKLTPQDIDKIIKQFDENGDQCIEFDEFITVLTNNIDKGESEAWLLEVFHIIDQDCDGLIRRVEIERVNRLYNLQIPEKEINQIFQAFDGLEAGINYEEFAGLLRHL